MSKLGIVAGGGRLPRRIAEVAAAGGRGVFLVAFQGQTDPDTVDGFPHAWMRLGATGATLSKFRDEGVTEVVMAGPMRRPAFSELALDTRSVVALARAGTRVMGDDGLLSVIIGEIERDGFRVIGVEDVLGGWLAPFGPIAGAEPDPDAQKDIDRGLAVLAAMGAVDVGQGVAVQEGLVLAVEAIEGTDAMLDRAGSVKREGAEGPILIKARKPGQEQRADLPTIGHETVRRAAAAGFRGIAIEGEGTLIVDKDAAVSEAERHGLFIHGVRGPNLDAGPRHPPHDDA